VGVLRLSFGAGLAALFVSGVLFVLVSELLLFGVVAEGEKIIVELVLGGENLVVVNVYTYSPLCAEIGVYLVEFIYY
jgi:hypothetical protein